MAEAGTLPELFTQLRNAKRRVERPDHRHVSTAATAAQSAARRRRSGPGVVGGGSSLADLNLFLRDFLALGYEASRATV
jgi:hypothetical protein